MAIIISIISSISHYINTKVIVTIYVIMRGTTTSECPSPYNLIAALHVFMTRRGNHTTHTK